MPVLSLLGQTLTAVVFHGVLLGGDALHFAMRPSIASSEAMVLGRPLFVIADALSSHRKPGRTDKSAQKMPALRGDMVASESASALVMNHRPAIAISHPISIA